MAKSENFIKLPVKRFGTRVRRLKSELAERIVIRFIIELIREIGSKDISNMAASISYYAVLAFFPLLLSLLAIMGLFLPSASIQKELVNFFSQSIPGSQSILQNNIPDIIRLRSTLGIIGIAGLIWSGTGVFSSVSSAINRSWHIRYRPPFYIKKPREIAMVLGAGVLFLLSFGASTFLSILGNLILPFSRILVNAGTVAVAFSLTLAIFILLNKFCPIIWTSWKHIWPGAILSSVLFEIAKTLFIFYLNHFQHYDRIYGSIASLIIILVWVYYSAFILILGAEFNSLLFRLKREGESFDKPDNRTDLLREF
jgi:membrane protein